MFRRFTCYVLIILLAVLAVAGINFYTGSIRVAKPLQIQEAPPSLKVVLVPLDSRPPCTQYVVELGRLGRINIITPPAELLDDYNTPAAKYALMAWLKEAAHDADAAIISTDMLIHGGLVASRLSLGNQADVSLTVNLLKELHQANPHMKIHAFNIIPRLLLANSDGNARYQQKMLKYSVLKDTIAVFENPSDIKKVSSLEEELPKEVIERYLALNDFNLAVNRQLIALAETGVLTSLAIGQDDGQPFGLPNMTKQRLANYISMHPDLADRVQITRGTDEVALTLLGRLYDQENKVSPKIYVRYSSPTAAGTVMPFMPHTVARTVEEKILLIGGTQVDSPDAADLILYVHIGTKHTSEETLRSAAQEVKRLITAGYQVALVDLSEEFYGHETVLPQLIANGAELNKLAAYAGWNTTSNSIGTAVTQGALYSNAYQHERSLSSRLSLYNTNLTFLTERFLDDWYYQKDVQPYINGKLRQRNIDTYHLGDHRAATEKWIARLLDSRAEYLLRNVLSTRPVIIDSDEGQATVVLSNLKTETKLPWDRTFEVKLHTTLDFNIID